MWEVVNSPAPSCGDLGTPYPDATLEAPVVDVMLERVIERTQPEVVHIQELAGLPSSLLEVVRHAGVPSLMTLQDYLLLCPTLKLLDHNRDVCLRRDVGDVCPRCCQRAPRDATPLVRATADYELNRLKDLVPPVVRSLLKRTRTAGVVQQISIADAPQTLLPELPRAEYQKRREVNVARLHLPDLLVAQSYRVAEIYRALGVQQEKLRTIHLTLKHLEQIRPRQVEISGAVQFGTLNGCISLQKGAHLIADAIRILESLGLSGRFHLHIWGGLLNEIRVELLSKPNVTYYGWYKVHNLDRMLETVDVGLIPSTWEEAFGFVGLELLAKGVPIIGNDRGGIRDYTIDGMTGWVNRSNDAAGLAQLMAAIIANPDSVPVLSRSIRARRGEFIKTMRAHGEEIEDVYRSLSRDPS